MLAIDRHHDGTRICCGPAVLPQMEVRHCHRGGLVERLNRELCPRTRAAAGRALRDFDLLREEPDMQVVSDTNDVIVLNLKRRYSGISSTVFRRVLVQAENITIATTDPVLPVFIPQFQLSKLMAMSRAGSSAPRVRHARRKMLDRHLIIHEAEAITHMNRHLLAKG